MMPVEQTLIIIKHDGVARGLVGKILERLEKVGLKMVAAKMAHPSKKQAEAHYDWGEEWMTNLGRKTLETYSKFGLDAKQVLGTDDPKILGKDVLEKLINYLSTGPVIVTVWEGVSAVAVARKITGSTTPMTAEMGSLRGEFSHDSQLIAPFKGRALQNLVHASGDAAEAKKEISLWFGQEFQPEQYERVDAIFF